MSTLSLICTVRDEADNIAALLDSMLAQTRQPDEIIINDCLSRDATPAIVRTYAAREPRIRLVCGGHNISSGRNNAIRHAHGDLIASTDAGLTLAPDWLEQLVAPLENGSADLVGGFYAPAPTTPFECALAATNFRTRDEIIPEQFLPAGNSMAFRRDVWQRIGGFPEWLSHSEDLYFDLAAEKLGYRRTFAANATIHFRPRSNLRAFARQYYFYARGDGIAGLWTRRHLIRYATYTTLLALLILAKRTPTLRPLISLLILLGTIAYTRTPYRRLIPQLSHYSPRERITMLALVPIIRLVGDGAKMVGYFVGVWGRKSTRGVRWMRGGLPY